MEQGDNKADSRSRIRRRNKGASQSNDAQENTATDGNAELEMVSDKKIVEKTDDQSSNNDPEEKPSRPPRKGGVNVIDESEEKPSEPPKKNVGDAKSVEEDASDKSKIKQREKDLESGPLKVLEPIRSDPIFQLKARHKKLERLTVQSLPEMHFIGRIVSGEGIAQHHSEGISCRWKVDFGQSWHHLGGDLQGQTHIAYCQHNIHDAITFDHPLDLHFAQIGMQGFGSLRILTQCYRVDEHGRRILAGYGFSHIPITSGIHNIEIMLWRPSGNMAEEMDSFFLGRVPALLSHEPIYDSAWQDRCKLVTVAAGKVNIQVFVISRFLSKHGIDANRN